MRRRVLQRSFARWPRAARSPARPFAHSPFRRPGLAFPKRRGIRSQGMLFRVSHVTDYHYTAPVAEAYLELRLKPLNRRDQAVKQHTLTLEPTVRSSDYEDYFVNLLSVISLPFRHSRLVIEIEAVVSTTRMPLPEQS